MRKYNNMIINETNCVFSEPLWWDKASVPPQLVPLDGGVDKDYVWNWSKEDCSTTDNTSTLIQNTTTGAEFYVKKTLNYGESIIIWFLTIFMIFIIFKSAYNFFWKK